MDRPQVKKILKFGFNSERTFGFVDAGFNRESFDKNIARLNEIGNIMIGTSGILSIDEINRLIKRLQNSWQAGADANEIELSLLEARSIGYGLDKSTTIDFINYIIKILENPENWTPSCLKGFLHSTLRLWTDFNPSVREANSTFIAKHSKEVDGELSRVAPYLSTDGPYKLGSDTRKQKKSYLWATSAVFMPSTRLNYTYFSDTILAYFKNAKEEDYDDLESALNLHNQSITDKVLLPLLINEKSSLNKRLLDIATKRIGDPFDEAKWATFDGATTEQTANLLRARKTLLGWIMQEIIRAFFEVLCNDKERKTFWYKHIHQIEDFTVFGSVYSKTRLFSTPLPSLTISNRFNTVQSQDSNSALALYIGKYVIIEFTQVGALYAYRVGEPNYRRVFRNAKNLRRIDDLKITSLPMLYDLDYHRYSIEGKMNHTGYWEGRMNNWISHHALI